VQAEGGRGCEMMMVPSTFAFCQHNDASERAFIRHRVLLTDDSPDMRWHPRLPHVENTANPLR
jgi:hypothetical protein